MRVREALSSLGLQDAEFFDVDWKERKRGEKIKGNPEARLGATGF